MAERAYDESWWVEDGTPDVILRSSSGSCARFDTHYSPDAERERAELAAAAPPMARLLMRLHARSETCFWCARSLGAPHAQDCELHRVLVRARILR